MKVKVRKKDKKKSMKIIQRKNSLLLRHAITFPGPIGM